jgi:hypothetical protein
MTVPGPGRSPEISPAPTHNTEAVGAEQHPSFLPGVVSNHRLPLGVAFLNVSNGSCANSPNKASANPELINCLEQMRCLT